MKKVLFSKLLLTLLLLVSTSALAHTGHLSNEPVHGLLHIEHIILLIAAALIVFVLKAINKK
jgi:hypothetical protein